MSNLLPKSYDNWLNRGNPADDPQSPSEYWLETVTDETWGKYSALPEPIKRQIENWIDRNSYDWETGGDDSWLLKKIEQLTELL